MKYASTGSNFVNSFEISWIKSSLTKISKKWHFTFAILSNKYNKRSKNHENYFTKPNDVSLISHSLDPDVFKLSSSILDVEVNQAFIANNCNKTLIVCLIVWWRQNSESDLIIRK